MSARPTLRERHQRALAGAMVDLPVQDPAYDGLFVRLRALSAEEITEAEARHRGTSDPGMQQALDLLVAACVGVWEQVDGKGVSPVDGFPGVMDLDSGTLSGALPTFSSPELAEALGVEPSAAAVVRALLGARSSLGVIAYAEALFEFSNVSSEQLLRQARGNSWGATPTSKPPQ